MPPPATAAVLPETVLFVKTIAAKLAMPPPNLAELPETVHSFKANVPLESLRMPPPPNIVVGGGVACDGGACRGQIAPIVNATAAVRAGHWRTVNRRSADIGPAAIERIPELATPDRQW